MTLKGVAGCGACRTPPLAGRLLVLLDEERDHEQRDDVDDLDHRVDRRAGRVLVGVADGVAGDGGGVGVGALAAVRAVLDQLLGVVPGAAALVIEMARKMPVMIEPMSTPPSTR